MALEWWLSLKKRGGGAGGETYPKIVTFKYVI